MNQTIKNLGLLAILPLALVALTADLIDEADAQNLDRYHQNPMDQQLMT